MSKFIYADNSATTRVKKEVVEAMLPYLYDNYGNASSKYHIGTQSKKVIEEARERIAKCINAEPNEIYFTSGGTESNNWALNGTHWIGIITSEFEHHSILNPCQRLQFQEEKNVSYIPVTEDGQVRLDVLAKILKNNSADKNKILTSIMTVNNEVGTIQPIKQISDIVHKYNGVFHTDCVQGIGHIPIDVKNMGIDMLSASGHKFHAPKGIGFLYKKDGIELGSFILGGSQERSLRAGTENVAYIVGIAKAMELACNNIEKREFKIAKLRNKLLENLLSIDRVFLNGSINNRISGNINICIEGIEGELLLNMLNMQDIYVSAGSACNSVSTEPSHVLTAMYNDDIRAYSSIRITLNEENTEEEIETISKAIKRIVNKMRNF